MVSILTVKSRVSRKTSGSHDLSSGSNLVISSSAIVCLILLIVPSRAVMALASSVITGEFSTEGPAPLKLFLQFPIIFNNLFFSPPARIFSLVWIT